jgi:hypothetical protein
LCPLNQILSHRAPVSIKIPDYPQVHISNILWDIMEKPHGGQIDDNEVGGACSTHGGEERCIHRVLAGRPEGKRSGVDGRIILRWILRKWDWGHGLD